MAPLPLDIIAPIVGLRRHIEIPRVLLIRLFHYELVFCIRIHLLNVGREIPRQIKPQWRRLTRIHRLVIIVLVFVLHWALACGGFLEKKKVGRETTKKNESDRGLIEILFFLKFGKVGDVFSFLSLSSRRLVF